MRTICVVEWTEYERGWGNRPDGLSLHPSRTSADAYIREYDAEHNSLPDVPDCYSILSKPYPMDVSDDVYDFIDGKGSHYSFRNDFETVVKEIVEKLSEGK